LTANRLASGGPIEICCEQECGMAKEPDNVGSTTAGASKPGGMPYEHVIMRAFDKLTSEIFIFLLAYVALVIGFAWLAPAMSRSLVVLLHVLPVVGIAAYVWQQSAGLARQATENGVDVWSGVATGSARVTGISGAVARTLGRVKVRSTLASGNARVTGVATGTGGDADSTDEIFLLDKFRKLDESSRQAVIREVMRRLDQRSTRDG
jgi:hypothetical protein